MMRALWTAGSGMIAQQFNVDVSSNNLANVNTTAYKKERAEFKDLLYATMNRAYMLDGVGRPVNLQVGHGVTVAATVRNFDSGNIERTDNPLDFAIVGEGFFMVLAPTGEVVYTRDGSFKISVTEEGNMLTTSEGYPVLDDMWDIILLDANPSDLVVGDDGTLSYVDVDGTVVPTGQRLGIVKFPNKHGLESIGNNLYAWTSASGEPVPDAEMGTMSIVKQRHLESSNVQVVEEMVKLIVAQRAYEISSKAIQSADEMLGMANNLRR